MNKLSPRKRRRARTRQEILDAALELLTEKGPNELSLREIARRVDYSPAALYEYFASKDEIIAGLCAEADRRLHSMLAAVPEGLPLTERLVEMGLAYIRFARHNPEHFMLNFVPFGGDPSDHKYSFEEAVNTDGAFKILLDAVQQGIDAGLFYTSQDYGLMQIAYGMYALSHGLAVSQLTNLRDVAFDYPSADRATLALFIKGLGHQSGQ